MTVPAAAGDRQTLFAKLSELIPTVEEAEIASRPGIDELRRSMRARRGNHLPILVTPKLPEREGKREVLDGSSRFWVAVWERLDGLWAVEIPPGLDEIERIVYAFGCNKFRRNVGDDEVVRHADLIIDSTGCTQREAAEKLGIDPSKLSRAYTNTGVPERHREAFRTLCGSVRTILARIRENALQDKAVAFATTPKPDGKLPSREEVLLFLERERAEKKPGRKASHLNGKFQGRVYRFAKARDEPSAVTAKWLRSLAKWYETMDKDGDFDFSV